MKNVYSGCLLFFALVASLFIGCSLEAPSIGHLAISVPYSYTSAAQSSASSSSRTISLDPNSSSYVRLYVLLNGSFVALTNDGTSYLEKSIADTTIPSYSIDLQASSGYKVYAVIGTKSNGLWTPKYYGGTDSFTVSAGVYTSKELKVSAAPFTEMYPSASATFAVVIDGSLWRVIGGSLTNGSTTVSLSSCGTIYSISEGQWFGTTSGTYVKEPWINTSTGIWAVKNSALIKRASIAAANSGALVVAGDTDTLMVFYYGTDIGFASTDQSSATAVDSSWDSGTLKGFLATPDGASFQTLIPDPGTFISDQTFVINGKSTYGFVATSIGTYMYNEGMKTKMGTDIMGWLKDQLKQSNYVMTASYNSKSVQITSLAFDSATSPKYIYAGTAVGLYRALASGIASATTAPTLGTLVSGVTVKKLAAATFGENSYVAYSDGAGMITILQDATVIKTYPFYAYTASVSGIVDLSFYTANNVLNLVITSSDGLAVLPVK